MSTGLFYTEQRQDWATPRDLFEALDREFHFTLDVCASAENAKVPQHLTEEDNALMLEWSGACYMNPPYAKMEQWVRKAHLEACRGAVVVCLLPVRTDTSWWHEWVTKAREVRFIRGRVRFEGTTSSAPFASAVVVFDRPEERPFYHKVSYVRLPLGRKRGNTP
jgi:site-specific DNA-methyltransferase (adenine-specific)